MPLNGISNSTEVECPVCNGDGVIYGPIEATISDSSRPCHECNGNGTLTMREIREYDEWLAYKTFN